MLVGDYVLVSKLSFGPRTPNTPLAFPLAHNTCLSGWEEGNLMPTNTLRLPENKRHAGEVKRHDLVVFNFPAGDTVAVRMPNPDYTAC